MPFDLKDITGEDPGKGKKTSPGFDLSDIREAAQQSAPTGVKQDLIGGGLDVNTNFKDFRFQPKTNADNYLLRAQDQGFWETAGKTLGNVAANIPLDIIQGLGYLGTTLEFGDDRDYTNALTQSMEKLKNPFGEIYREHPDKTFDMTDSAWWFDNLGQLAESSASFAVEGAGIAKLFGTLAKGAAWSTRAAKLAMKGAQGLSAATLTYMEGAMSGAQIYETAYNNNYMKLINQGVDATQADLNARHIASQAAAATVQLHTAINIGLNLTGLTPLFREEDQAITSWWRRNGAPLKGETKAEWATRIAESAPEGAPLKKLLGLGMEGPARLGLEAFQEGLEEVNTQYAEHVGRSIGEGKEDKDVAHRLIDVDRYFSEVLNQEGALNMALGALGGLAQTVLLDHIPVHKVVKYGSDGKPLMTEKGGYQTERISSHTMNERMNRQYFDNIKDALSKDMDWFSQKNKDLEQAFKDKDLAAIARTKADLLSVHNLRAISLGLGDVWKQQYQDIADLDNTKSAAADALQPQLEQLTGQMQEAFNNGDTDTANQLNAERMQILEKQNQLQDVTEAMQKGYAQDKSDNSYREKAMKAIHNLDYLTDLYQDMQDRYTGTPEMEASGISEHMFYRQANLYLQKQQIDQMQQDLLKLKAKVDQMTLTEQDDVLISQAKDFISDREIWQKTVNKLNNDIQRVNEAIKNNNSTLFNKILDKYKIPNKPGAGKTLIDTLERRKVELQKRADYTSKELNDTIAVWKETNPGKSVDEVLRRASERPIIEDIYKQNKEYYQQAITEHEIAKEQFGKDSTEKGIQNFIKENQPQSDKSKQNKDHIEAYNQQMDREIAASMDAKQKQQAVTQIDKQIAEVQQKIQDKKYHKQNLLNARNNLQGGFFKKLGKKMEIDDDIRNRDAEIASLNYELGVLIQRKAAMTETANQATQQAQNVARTPPPVVQPIDQITPASTPAQNTTIQPTEEQVQEDNIPDLDFSQEIVPKFTTVQEGNPVFDQLVGGNEAGITLRQFVQLRKDRDVPFLISAVRTMIEKTNLPMPTAEEFEDFIKPYITALRDQYRNQQMNPEESYVQLKSMLKPDVLTVLDILEGEFKEHGFSYDRALQVLNQQVKEGNLAKAMINQIMVRMKNYMEYVEQPTSTEPEHVEPIQAATQSATSIVPLKIVDAHTRTERELTDQDWSIFEDQLLNRLRTDIPLPNAIEYASQIGTSSKISTVENGTFFDKLVPAIQRWIEQTKNGTTTMSLKDYLGVEQESNTKEFNEEPTTYISPTPDSEPTIFSNASLDMETVQQDQKRFVGATNIEAIKANFSTNPYLEFDNGKEIRIVTDYTRLDEKVNPDVLIPGAIVPGDDVVFEVDTEWTGEINYDTEMMQDDYGEQLRRADSFQNYLESPDKIGMSSTAQHPRGAHANVPIKIIQKSTGKTIGYLPRADWVTAKYPDTGNYRNVTDTYQDGDTMVTDNVARQYSRIIKLREAIARAWNTNKELKLVSKVSNRGAGHVMLNRDVNKNTGTTKLVNRSAKNMLPDPSLEIAIMKQGNPYVASGVLSQKQLHSTIPSYMMTASSMPVAMLPAPNGKYIPTPLYTHRLGDNPSQLNTLIGAIELYLRNAGEQQRPTDQKAIDKIREASGYDIRIPEQLRNFIQQYFTYTQKFGEKDTVITPSEVSGNAIAEFMLDIPDLIPGEKISFIKVGTSFSGEKPIYAQLINGELHPDFEQAIRQGLSNRFKNVVFAGKSLRGINSSGEFKAPIIKKDGTVQVNTFKDYNEFVKANSSTFAYGLNKVGNQYVYTANPVVQIDYDAALKSAPPVVSTAIGEQRQGTTPSESEQLEEPDELADLFGNGMLSPSPSSVTPLQVPSQGGQVSLELLQELRNLTPEAHRNSISPEQALRELLERGVTVLADGHNPFYVC